VDGHFVESYYPTIENTFSKVIKHKGQEFATEIIDTAGQVRSVCCFIFALVQARLTCDATIKEGVLTIQ
jgi:GTPase SAR1 family protein